MAITATNVSFDYGTESILAGLNFGVAPGEFVGIVGQSGSGKSTLLRILAGLLHPNEGCVLKDGRLRMVFQEGALLPWLTAGANVELGRCRRSLRSNLNLLLRGGLFGRFLATDFSREIGSLAADLGMKDLMSRYPTELSGGERQRLSIARAFAGLPQVVLMDEPFGSLDVFTREKMQDWLLSFWGEHKSSIVFVTHDVEEAILLSDRVCILRDGAISCEVDIPFLRPRSAGMKYSEQFLRLRRRLSKKLTTSSESDQL